MDKTVCFWCTQTEADVFKCVLSFFFKKDFALIFAFKVPINVFIIWTVANLFNPQIEKQFWV